MKQSLHTMLSMSDTYFILITAAVKKGSPVTVTMIRTTGIVFSFLLQTQNNEGLPSISSIFGAMVISGAVSLMTFETRINEKLESSKCCRSHRESEDQQSNIIQSPCSSILKQSMAWSFQKFHCWWKLKFKVCFFSLNYGSSFQRTNLPWTLINHFIGVKITFI